jgi:hypothetical protein
VFSATICWPVDPAAADSARAVRPASSLISRSRSASCCRARWTLDEQVRVITQLDSEPGQLGADLVQVSRDQCAGVGVDGQPAVLVGLGVLADAPSPQPRPDETQIPFDLGAGERVRTAGLPFTRRLLCLLSYTGGRL